MLNIRPTARLLAVEPSKRPRVLPLTGYFVLLIKAASTLAGSGRLLARLTADECVSISSSGPASTESLMSLGWLVNQRGALSRIAEELVITANQVSSTKLQISFML